MPRNIIFPEEEQENVKPTKILSKNQASQHESYVLELSQEDVLADSYWKTNLMIDEGEDKIKRKDKKTRKNTSFQNKIINDHVWAMIKTVCQVEQNSSIQTCQKICSQISHKEAQIKSGIKEDQVRLFFSENTYFTEDQKTQLIDKFQYHFQNYQILTKILSRLQAVGEYNEQLAFVIVKIVSFISENYQLSYRKYDQKFLAEELPSKLHKVVQYITDQQNVKLINPQYFYNSNEPKYVKIIEVWFYSIFSIKLGLTGNKYLPTNQQMELQ